MDDKDTVNDLSIFPGVLLIRNVAFSWKGHILQMDTLSNSVIHMHVETTHVKMCSHTVAQEHSYIHPIPEGLLSLEIRRLNPTVQNGLGPSWLWVNFLWAVSLNVCFQHQCFAFNGSCLLFEFKDGIKLFKREVTQWKHHLAVSHCRTACGCIHVHICVSLCVLSLSTEWTKFRSCIKA